MSILNRRDLIAMARRLSLVALLGKSSNYSISQVKPPNSSPPSPTADGLNADNSSWEATRQSQQNMSNYIQDALHGMGTISDFQRTVNYQGPTISAAPDPALNLPIWPGPFLWGDESSLDGATHEDFPQAPNQFNPQTGRFLNDEGQPYIQEYDFDFGSIW
jgi:hypothetical protein